ncbi:MAG: branched-chain amino acid aminotransferase, partial [Acidobacteria bacterium]|nr:branched-chain amino acid aminotransferase [Acidobacteriota bacterium]
MNDVAVNVNGRIGNAETAVVPVFDHGFLFGEGVYETLRTYNRRPFLLDRHFDRLRASAAAIGLEVPLTDTQLAERIEETVAAAVIDGERYIRLLVTRGVGGLSYDPRECGEPTVVVIVKAHAATPPEVPARGIGIGVCSV